MGGHACGFVDVKDAIHIIYLIPTQGTRKGMPLPYDDGYALLFIVRDDGRFVYGRGIPYGCPGVLIPHSFPFLIPV